MHLFEIHDQSWFPSFLRDGVTDGLYTMWKVMFWKNTLPHIEDLLRHAKGNCILDLCSGAGGPLPLVSSALLQKYPELRIHLSDIHPHQSWENPLKRDIPVAYLGDSINAMDVPHGLGNARTLFESFHHFRPNQAIEILRNAVIAKHPIAIFEFQRRQVWDSLLPPIPLVLWVAVFLNWFHTPFRWSKLLFTIIPIIPFVLAFDGVVSILRTYTTDELADMAAQAGTTGYRWQVRQTTNRGLGRMTCLIGWPAAEGGVEIVPYPNE